MCAISLSQTENVKHVVLVMSDIGDQISPREELKNIKNIKNIKMGGDVLIELF